MAATAQRTFSGYGRHLRARPAERPVLDVAAAPARPDSVWDEVALGLGNERCAYCVGHGFITRYEGKRPCNCVYRAAFRAVLDRCRKIDVMGENNFRAYELCADLFLVSRRTLLTAPAAELEAAEAEELRARMEFEAASRPPCFGIRKPLARAALKMATARLKRARIEKPRGLAEWQVFRTYHLAGMRWDESIRFVGCKRGDFFHLVYSVERKLGRVFGELRPYALFPVDEYMGGVN